MTPVIVTTSRRSRRSRTHSELVRREPGSGSLGRDRQDHRTDRSHCRRARQWPDHHQSHRCGHLHQQSRRRIEASVCARSRIGRALPRITASERSNIEDALEHLEEASIGTIHSFCAQILRERPVEAVVDPAFEELSEQQACSNLRTGVSRLDSAQTGPGRSRACAARWSAWLRVILTIALPRSNSCNTRPGS